MSIITPAQLWENYNRFGVDDAGYLKVDPFDYRVYFNGQRIDDNQIVRVYARLKLPKNQTNPPVLIFLSHLQDDVDNIEVSPFLQYGYAVLCVDYAGLNNYAHSTKYPRSIINQTTFGNNGIDGDPKTSCWYHYTTCILHAITFLENCPHVNSQNIGIVGVSEGASLVFKTAFITKLKAGMTFFCADNPKSQDLSYLASLDSKAYTKNNFPILINASSNEKNGSLDYLNEMYNMLNGCYFCILPRADKCVGRLQRANIKPWFDYHFNNQTQPLPKPQMNMFLSEDSLYVELNQECKTALVYASSNDIPYLRNWNEIPLTKLAGQKYLGKIEVYSPKTVLAFGVVTMENGFTFSTPVLSKNPIKLNELKKSRLIYNSDMGVDVFMRENGSFFKDRHPIIKEGTPNISGIFGNEITTFKLGESRFCAEEGSLLQITLFTSTPQEVEISILTLEQNQPSQFSSIKKLTEGDWTTLTLSQEDFKSNEGRPQFVNAVCLTIKGKSIIVNSILWI